MKPARLFHLARAREWEAFLRSSGAPWAPPSLAAEGFVHLSFAHQLPGTLEAHFGGEEALVLVEVDARAVADALVVEPSRGGAGFPHLYRALRRREVERTWPLARRGGAWSLPALAPDPEGDSPAGRLPAAETRGPPEPPRPRRSTWSNEDARARARRGGLARRPPCRAARASPCGSPGRSP